MFFDAIQKGFESASPLTFRHSGQVAVVRKNDRPGSQCGGYFFHDAAGLMPDAVVA
jgi:hypothetical protein